MKFIFRILAAASLCASASGAHAAPVTIDFDGLDGGLDHVHIEHVASAGDGAM